MLLLVAVAGVLFALRGGGDDDTLEGTAAPVVSPSPTPSASAPAEPPPPAAPPAAPGGQVEFQGAVVTLPAGWRFQDDGAGRGCATRAPDTCDLLMVLPDVVESTGREIQQPRTDGDTGWYLGTDVPDCRSSRLVTRELAPIQDKQAEYREWEVDCAGSAPFLRMWWLPKTGFAAVDQSADPAVRDVVDEIVRTTDLSGLRRA